MDEFSRNGVDLGKGCFQAHGLRAADGSAVSRKLSPSARPFFAQRIDALSELAENDASRPQEAREAAKPLTLPSEGRTRSIDAMERAKSPRPAPAARPAAGSTAFPGLARSSPRRLRQASPTRAPSSRDATSPLGWG